MCSGAPGRSRTCGPRLRRPDEADPPRGKDSQPVATTRDGAAADSRASQIFAPFTEDSADRLRTQLTVSPGFVRNREGVSPAKARVAGSNPVFRSNQGLGFTSQVPAIRTDKGRFRRLRPSPHT